MANLDRSFPRELQPTGLVAILGGIDGPNRLAQYFHLAMFSELAVTAAWGATFRVASLFIAWAWMHVVHIIMNRLLKNRVEAFLLDLIMIVIFYSFGCYRCVCACALKA